MVFDSFRPKPMVLELYEKSQKRLKMTFFAFFMKLKTWRLLSKTIKHHENKLILGSFMSIYSLNDLFQKLGDLRTFLSVPLLSNKGIYIENSENQKPSPAIP